MAFARRALTVLIAVAVALAPVGAASAAAHTPASKAQTTNLTHTMHTTTMHQDHRGMHAATQKADEPCAHKMGRTCCCDDKGTCAQTCLQKCFGQVALIPPDRANRLPTPVRFSAPPFERPPDWSPAPQLPPPRA